MSDPDALRSVFEDHSDLQMDNLTKPNPILRLKRLIRSLQSTRREQCPIMALPIDPQPTPMVPTVVSKLSVPPIILPSLPLFQLTHYSLHIYDPKDHITWGRTSQKSGGEHTLSGWKIMMTTTTGSPAGWMTQESNFQFELAKIL